MIKTKLRFGSVLLALIPALLAGVLIRLYFTNHAEVALEEQARTPVQGCYVNQFLAEYKHRNNGESVAIEPLVNKLGDTGFVFQQLYIQSNPNPLGNKDQLEESSEGSSYSRVHALYHPALRELPQRFGYYDIFLISSCRNA